MRKLDRTTARPDDEELAIAQNVVRLSDFGFARDLAELRHFIKNFENINLIGWQ